MQKPRILCVDDEPRVLESLTLVLERQFRVVTAAGGPEALSILAGDRDFAVVISDMRMPEMDGARFLEKVEALAPTSVRLLLTGQSDLDTAIRAINHGRIFRFLSKPCPPAIMSEALAAAIRQHELLVSEQVLLQDTLVGSIEALCEVLAMADPVSYGRAQRLKRHAAELAAATACPDSWQIEMAAMLSRLGYVSLPGDVLERFHAGKPLTPAEDLMVARVPEVTESLLRHIPRLEPVRAMLRELAAPPPVPPVAESRGTAVLRIVADFDALVSGDSTPGRALDIMRGRTGAYASDLLGEFSRLHSDADERLEVREIERSALRCGMILADDLRLRTGAVLVARGYCVTESLLSRLRNLDRNALRQSPRVIVARAAEPSKPRN
jgi:CheY-like chemotaxis protein